MADKVFNVLFVCTGNSARSILAECIMNREGLGKFKGFSAGSTPKGSVHPFAIDLLKTLNYKTDDLRSKDWAEFTQPGAPELDFVFTLCDSAANEACPVFPGQPTSAHWGLPDPAAATGNEALRRAAFADAYRMINNRVSIFANLPMTSLDKLSLKARLEEIGQAQPPEAKESA